MAAKKKSEKDIQKQIAELPVLKPKVGLSPHELAKRACHANFILHKAHKIYWKHRDSEVAEAAWRKAVADAKVAVNDCYPKDFWDNFDDFLEGDVKHLETYLSFLELNLWFFRSGYIKADIIRILCRTKLDESQVERVQRIVLDAIQQHYRREFRSYCKLARKVDSDSFRKQLKKFLNHEDKDIRRRATWVLHYCDGIHHLTDNEKSIYRSQCDVVNYTEKIKTFPFHSQYVIARADEYLYLKKYDLALADCNKALTLDSDKNDCYRIRAQVYYGLGRYQESVLDAERALEDYPRSYAIHAVCARSLYSLKRYEESIVCWDKAIELYSAWGRYYSERALAYNQLGDSVRALEDATNAIKMNSKSSYSYEVRAIIHSSSENWESAFSDCNNAVLYSPDDEDYRIRRMYLGIKLGLYQRVIADGLKVLKSNSKNMRAYAYSGWAHILSGDKEKGCTEIDYAILLSPADANWLNDIRKLAE